MVSFKRLAFFHNGWPVTPFALQLARYLAAAGMGVDFVYDEAFMSKADVKNYQRIPNLRLVHLESPVRRPKTRPECLLYLAGLHKAFLAARKEPYAALVGIEKQGLALAALLGNTLHIPHIHWSLELYLAENPDWMRGDPCADFWLVTEEDAHKSALATIIQDEDRAAALRAATGHEGNSVYLPVAISADNIRPRGGHALHDLYGIDHSRKILLCYGNNRMPADWVLALRDSLPDPWVLVLHGLHMYGLQGVRDDPRLRISSARVPEMAIPALIASASAGLAYYPADDINQTLTAFASEKLARYLCAGIPVVAAGIRNIHRLFDEYPCGVSLTEPLQIAVILRTIDKNEELFRKAAAAAGKKYVLENAGHEAIRFFVKLAREDGTPDCERPR